MIDHKAGIFQEGIESPIVLNAADSPIERILNAGFLGASTSDLLALCLARNEDAVGDAEVRARELLRGLGKLQAVAELSREQVRQLTGCEDFQALQSLAWMELGRRTAHAGKGEMPTVMSPQDVAHHLKHLRREKREHFVVLLLDAKNNLMRTQTIHIGTLSMSMVGPREVFREAIREGASSIIVAHNHPSGDPTPSPEDEAITRRLAELGQMLDIQVWDHIIVGDPDWVSLRSQGVFDKK